MNDPQIRNTLIRKLQANYSAVSDTIILEEMGLDHGTARIDIAVINSAIHGFEIKSDRDNLKRLPEQKRIYGSVLDQITLVTGYRHAYEALQIVPDWWGIVLAEMRSDGSVYLSDARDAQHNPYQIPVSIARLLWRNEALELLEQMGKANDIRSKPRSIIYERLANTVDLQELRLMVCTKLRNRTDWRSDIRRMSYDG